MRKLRTLLTLLVVSLCAVQSAWARTAPTLPAAKTLESGKTYYLYNVGSDRFVSFESNYYYNAPLACTDQGKAVKISLVNGTQYNIMFLEGENYWYGYSSDPLHSQSTSSLNGDYYRFTILPVADGYTIQRVYYSNENEFVGYDGRNGNLMYTNLTEGNIVFQLMDADEAARYIAKRNLYRALESATGYNVEKYDAIYENESSSNYALQEAADRLYKAVDASNTVKKPDWTDYNILFEMDPSYAWYYYSNLDYFESKSFQEGSQLLNATIEVDDDATLVYTFDGNSYFNMEVYVDDILKYTINIHEGSSGQRYFLKLAPGKHFVTWKAINNTKTYTWCRIRDIGVERTPTIVVSLPEPGSLGTEVLKNTDHIQNVRRLVVSGEMNADDWARVMMMTSLFSLDLTDCTITEIPKEQLSRYYHSDNLSFFHEVKLPNTLKKIGEYAFYESYLDDITFPEGLETIDKYAFSRTRIKNALIPETVTLVGEDAFYDNQSLENASYPAAAQSIPQSCFYGCNVMKPFDIPEGIVTIGSGAFYDCYAFKSDIPASVTSIGSSAFYCTGMEHVTIRENVSVGSYAFSHCNNLTTISLPTSMYDEIYELVAYCGALTDVWFKSPTMVTASRNNIFRGNSAANLTVHVPSYLVNTYKQDSYWYNYNIAGFSTADVTDWNINRALSLKAGERFEGTPNVTIHSTPGSMSISGDDAMTINNFTVNVTGSNSNRAQVISNCKNITINGQFKYRYWTDAKRWYFISLPFDTKVGNIVALSGSKAVRYYDGANRAANGTGGNWKNYSGDDIIPAGTGFIYQTSKETWTEFYAEDNASKQYVFSNKEFVKSLTANDASSAANKGWNLVGNPWLSYYNIHKLNFTAPITVWNVNDRKYEAYSIIDDDYAIKPADAFFVQCPDEVSSISFPIDGRQLTSKIESQNAAPSFDGMTSERRLVDIILSDGELTDKTRFVLNPKAKLDYETTCDASKFFSLDNQVPQIYTIQNDVQMAINERPAADGIIQLGMMVAEAGTYTIKSERNELPAAVLVDKQSGTETVLTPEGYSFSTEAGTIDNRFELRLSAGETTGIRSVSDNDEAAKSYYNLNGQHVDAPQKGIYVVNGKKVVIK